MSEANQATQLDQALGAESESTTIHDGDTLRAVVITPLKLKQFSQVLKCINELADAGVSLESGIDSMRLLMTGGDIAIKLIAIASGESVQTIEQLELDEAANLAGAIWRINKSFFQKKAATMLAAFGLTPEQVDKAKEFWNGLTSSASSSVTATS